MPGESSLRQEMWAFLRAAAEHWRQIIGGSLLFLLAGVAASLGLNVPPSISGIAALSLAVVCACFLCWRDEHNRAESLAERLRPRLQVTVNEKSIANAIWDGEHWVIFLRVIVSSLTARRIENAKAYLVSIEKDSKTLWDDQEMPLTFSPGENPDALCKTIEHGGHYPLDVMIVRRGDDALFMGTPQRAWPHFDSLHEIFAETGEYILNIRVSADDCPSVVARVMFHWGGSSFECGIDVLPASSPANGSR